MYKLLCIALGVWLWVGTSVCGAWQAPIPGEAERPSAVLLIDKTAAELTVLRGTQDTSFLCSSGQVPGDKQAEGDRRTPEGVYFVTRHISGGLDFMEYGGSAWVLNYPNPVDKLRGKTGHGIWIHSRGRAITPLESKGCVVLNLEDFAKLGRLELGLPVLLADTLQKSVGEKTREQELSAVQRQQVLERTQAWLSALQKQSPTLFSLYNPEAYALTRKSTFSAFIKNWEERFLEAPSFTMAHGPVQILEGPGYWVSFFSHSLQTAKEKQTGVRRLYWMPDPQGILKIVGVDWVPGR